MNSDDDQSSVSSDNSRTNSKKGSFRMRFKSISSMADRSRYNIIDGTKTVRSKIAKQLKRTSSESLEIKEKCKDSETISFPGCDLFDAIEFNFPAFPKNQDKEADEKELPQPQYPPPPLPTEQSYDQVFFDWSSPSNSYSYNQDKLLSNLDAAEAMYIPLCSRNSYDLGSDHLSSFDNDSEIFEAINNKFESLNKSSTNLESNENKATAFDSLFSSSETSSSSKSTDGPADHHRYVNWNFPSNEKISAPRSTNTLLKSVINQFDPLNDMAYSENDDERSLDIMDLLQFDDSGNEDLTRAEDTQQEVTTALSEMHTVDVGKLDDFLLKEKRKNSLISTASIGSFMTIKHRAMMAVRGAPHVLRRVSMSLTKDSGPCLKTETSSICKPDISMTFQASLYSGYLYKSPSMGEKSKDFVKRWCSISEGKLFYSIEKESAKESVDLNTVMSICLVKDQKQNNDGDDLYCFEITTTSSKGRGHLFATTCTSERCVWLQKFLENLFPTFPARYSSEFTRAGWCWLKEGINGTWIACWILLQKRTFVFERKEELVEVDLRKARYVVLQDVKEVNLNDNSKQAILLDTVSMPRSLYLTMGRPSETNEWQRMLRAAATDNSISLEDQQLTKDDIPVIVEKCINFIYAHGSMTHGIYRCSGSLTKVTKLLSLFRQDSWSIQLSHPDYSEHDVANVLKKFFRDLPEPLFTTHLHKHFCNAPAIQCSEEEKLSMYRSLLEQMKPINYVTLRKLIGHLNFIHQQHEKNLMPVENLASLWGPTLMHVENNGSSQWSESECKVVHDLIFLYPKLFMVDDEELERETKSLQVLEMYHNSPTSMPQSFKPSGDLKVGIHLNSKESGEQVIISIGPNKCCDSVCEELAAKMKTEPHLLCLQEVICNESLKRPLHHKECILDSVLRWGYWDEIDRKNNYLLLTTENIIREVLPLAKPPLTITSELKFADRKMKSFKNFLFEVSKGNLCYYKDKKSLVKIHEWKIQDVVWYDGFESKRDPQSRWAMTFINKNDKQNRNKETPYFGYTIAGSQKEEQLRWIAALLLAQHSVESLLPSATLLK